MATVEEKRSKQILVVEDDPDTAELLVQQLERDDLELEVARNGQEAILVTGELAPDLIIVDLMMPKLDGHETSRFLKAKFRSAFMPILVLTAKDDPHSRAKSARFGCDDYLTKPYRRANLLVAVDELLELGALENRLLHASAREEERKQAQVRRAAAEADGETTDLPAIPDSIDVFGVEERIVVLRLQIAERQIGGGAQELASNHLERVLGLVPEQPRAKELMGKLGAV